MRKSFVFLLICLSTSLYAERKPKVLLFGYRRDVDPVYLQLFIPHGIECRIVRKWVPASEYEKYSVVYVAGPLKWMKDVKKHDMWTGSQSEIKAIEKFLSDGGVLILSNYGITKLGDLQKKESKLAKIIGFAGIKSYKGTEVSGVKVVATGKMYKWNSSIYKIVADSLSNAKSVANVVGVDGKEIGAFATMNRFGKGYVFWFSTPYMSVFEDCLKNNAKLDVARAYGDIIMDAIKKGNIKIKPLLNEKWSLNPLGDSK